VPRYLRIITLGLITWTGIVSAWVEQTPLGSVLATVAIVSGAVFLLVTD
jgi:hypothetical protein